MTEPTDVPEYELSRKAKIVCVSIVIIFFIALGLNTFTDLLPDQLLYLATLITGPTLMLVNATSLSIWVRKEPESGSTRVNPERQADAWVATFALLLIQQGNIDLDSAIDAGKSVLQSVSDIETRTAESAASEYLAALNPPAEEQI